VLGKLFVLYEFEAPTACKAIGKGEILVFYFTSLS